MQKTKLTVRVDQELLLNLKRYAALNNTTLTDLIDTYLRRIPKPVSEGHTPIVSWLSGVLDQGSSVEEYNQHLEEKYAR